MDNNLNNFISNENTSIPNTVIFNNYFIKNLIISPTDINSYDKIPFYTDNYFQVNQYRSSFSPFPKKSQFQNSPSPKRSDKKDKEINNPISFIKNITPIISNKNMNKYNYINMEESSKNSKENQNPTIPNLQRIIPEEKHPQDSKKKIVIKNHLEKIQKIIFKNILRSSLPQDHLKKLKNENGALRNLSMEHKLNKNIFERGPRNNLSKRRLFKNSKTLKEEPYLAPKNSMSLKEFQFGEQIGKGTFGNIFSVKWTRNNKYYAVKKEILNKIEDIQNRRRIFKIMQNFIKNTSCEGIVKLYGNLCMKKNDINYNLNIKNINNINDNNNSNEYIYFELMEKAERDWDSEIHKRSQKKLFYTEKEIIKIITQLIRTLSLLQKNHITHRDIKPQNILISKGIYKLCDFGEIRVLERDGVIVQRVRGSELYMSPILFYGLHNNLIQVKHNNYKSDVFSLGMCLFYACSLNYSGVDLIREINNMKNIKEILFQYLGNRYSDKLILAILSMLEVDENKRYDFIQLEKNLKFNIM